MNRKTAHGTSHRATITLLALILGWICEAYASPEAHDAASTNPGPGSGAQTALAPSASTQAPSHGAETGTVQILVFSTMHCPPCRVVGHVIEEVRHEFADQVSLVKFNVRDRFGHARMKEHGIDAYPTVLLIHDGIERARWIGVQPKSKYLEVLIDALHIDRPIRDEEREMPEI